MLWFKHHLEITNVTLGCIRQQAFPGSVCPVASLFRVSNSLMWKRDSRSSWIWSTAEALFFTSGSLVQILNVLVTGWRFEGLGGLNSPLQRIHTTTRCPPLSSSRQRSPGRYPFNMTASASFSLSRLFWLFCRLFLLAESSPVPSNKRAMNASPSRRM